MLTQVWTKTASIEALTILLSVIEEKYLKMIVIQPSFFKKPTSDIFITFCDFLLNGSLSIVILTQSPRQVGVEEWQRRLQIR